MEGVIGDIYISEAQREIYLVRNTIPPVRLRDHDDEGKQQEKFQVYTHNWVRKNAQMNSVDKRRMGELRDVVHVKILRRKLVRSQLKRAGHMERIDGNG